MKRYSHDRGRDQETVGTLRSLCCFRGGQRRFANTHGFSEQFISMVLSGNAKPSARLVVAVSATEGETDGR